MRTTFTRTLVLLTIVGLSGCYTAMDGWRMPRTSDFSWKQNDSGPSTEDLIRKPEVSLGPPSASRNEIAKANNNPSDPPMTAERASNSPREYPNTSSNINGKPVRYVKSSQTLQDYRKKMDRSGYSRNTLPQDGPYNAGSNSSEDYSKSGSDYPKTSSRLDSSQDGYGRTDSRSDSQYEIADRRRSSTFGAGSNRLDLDRFDRKDRRTDSKSSPYDRTKDPYKIKKFDSASTNDNESDYKPYQGSQRRTSTGQDYRTRKSHDSGSALDTALQANSHALSGGDRDRNVGKGDDANNYSRRNTFVDESDNDDYGRTTNRTAPLGSDIDSSDSQDDREGSRTRDNDYRSSSIDRRSDDGYDSQTRDAGFSPGGTSRYESRNRTADHQGSTRR